MEVERAVQIGIDKITVVQELAYFIKNAETKDEMLYILAKMDAVLKEGIAKLESDD